MRDNLTFKLIYYVASIVLKCISTRPPYHTEYMTMFPTHFTLRWLSELGMILAAILSVNYSDM